MASKSIWFLISRVAIYVTWRCILAKHIKLILTIPKVKFVEREKNNQKGETVMNLEITEDYNRFM
jgi:hypothetical protein